MIVASMANMINCIEHGKINSMSTIVKLNITYMMQ